MNGRVHAGASAGKIVCECFSSQNVAIVMGTNRRDAGDPGLALA